MNNRNNGVNEILPIVIIALITTFISITFGVLKIIKQILFEDVCLNPKKTYKHETKITFSFMIDYNNNGNNRKKRAFKMSKGHLFCHNKIETAVNQVLRICDNNKLWNNQSNVFYNVQCYHIESQHYFKKITIFFQIYLYSSQLDKHFEILNKLQDTIGDMLDKNTSIGNNFQSILRDKMFKFKDASLILKFKSYQNTLF